MRWLAKLLLLSGLIGSWVGCSQQPESLTPMNGDNPVNVQLDITSGMPPPTWQLSEAQRSAFFRMLEQLTPVEPQQAFDNLGNRGFVATTTNPTRTIRIQQGFVWITADSYERVFLDNNNDLERLLLTSGQSVLEPGLYTMLENGIGQN